MRISRILAVGVSLCLAAVLAHAASNPKLHQAKPVHAASVTPPPVLPNCAYQNINIAKYGQQPFVDAPVIRADDTTHKLTAALDVRYSDRATTTIAGCHVHLRTYNGALVGPTLRVHPGDQMDITLTNDLPENGAVCTTPEEMAMGHMSEAESEKVLSVTNLHTHGLHVSPSGISDNIFIQICPGGKTQHYVIDVPKDQPPGTYWYHAHVHGSTAVQVSSGMEGAIIVDGGQDMLPQIAKAKERIFVLQQIAYNQQGEIESLSQLTPSSWPDSKRYLTVNGQIAPVITMHPGEVQLWRFVHGGVRETINLRAPTPATPLNEIATDGNATGRVDAWQLLELEPGYRSDVLFKAPMLTAGQTKTTIYLRTAVVQGAQRLQFRTGVPRAQLNAELAKIQPSQVVAVIEISGAPEDMQLPSDAELAPFVPFKPITADELNGAEQHMAFSIQNAVCKGDAPCTPCTPPATGPSDCGIRFMVDMHQYPDSPTRLIKLNTASKWDLSVAPASVAPVHPFHIHVNPFWMERAGPDGKPQMVWKDTLLIHQNAPVSVLSRYTDFDGAFVLHCHILDHEDQGMMQKVEIVK
ncbi:MAG TPA: multicopper oxidase family protein [Rhizomicrobium sp.]|jgi:FtsP/CotA-like multicopper oxidase with cupredoxin domain